jgi:hypothetical protein
VRAAQEHLPLPPAARTARSPRWRWRGAWRRRCRPGMRSRTVSGCGAGTCTALAVSARQPRSTLSASGSPCSASFPASRTASARASGSGSSAAQRSAARAVVKDAADWPASFCRALAASALLGAGAEVTRWKQRASSRCTAWCTVCTVARQRGAGTNLSRRFCKQSLRTSGSACESGASSLSMLSACEDEGIAVCRSRPSGLDAALGKPRCSWIDSEGTATIRSSPGTATSKRITEGCGLAVHDQERCLCSHNTNFVL